MLNANPIVVVEVVVIVSSYKREVNVSGLYPKVNGSKTNLPTD